MWANRYWAKTYWAGNYWTPNTQTQDVELLGGGGYVYIPASQKKYIQKIHITKLVERISSKPLPKKKLRKDLEKLSSALNVPLTSFEQINQIQPADLLKEKKAIEILIKMYVSFLAKEEDDLLLLLVALDLI